MILGNINDEYKECGIQFEELELSGDNYSQQYGIFSAIDDKYVYVIGFKSFEESMIVVN